jgi:perosamine synthetase
MKGILTELNQYKGEQVEIIPWSVPYIDSREKNLVNQAIDSTWLSMGPLVNQFELELAEITGAKFCVATSNGTTALHLGYLALGLKIGDKIAIPAYGFMAAANIAIQMGLDILFYDVDPETMNVLHSELERLSKTKLVAFVVIQNYGNMNNMSLIEEWAAENGVLLIEDAAESLGSSFGDRKSGNFGAISTMSFHGAKTITTGEGGAVFTNDQEIYEILKLYRSHGVRKEPYKHELPGHNFRMSNLQGALGVAQVEKLSEVLQRKKSIQDQYSKLLAGSNWNLPVVIPSAKVIFWAIPVWQQDSNKRPLNDVINSLNAKGIETRNGFYSANRLDIYHAQQIFPNANKFSEECIILPSYFHLKQEQIAYICQSLLEM